MKQTSVALGVVLLISSSFGCTRAHTVLKVKNAADVSLAVQQIGSATLEPVPAGNSDVNLRLSAINVDEDGYLQREGGVLRIACNKCEGKTFTLLNGERLSASAELSVEEIVAEQGVELPFEYQVSANEEIYPLLRTADSNVEYFEQTTEPVSELGWLLVPGGLLTVVGLIVIPQDAVAGMLMFVPGLALDVVGGIHLVLPEDTQRFNAQGQPIAVRPARAPRRAAPPAAESDETTGDDGESTAEDSDRVDADAEPSTDE